MGQLETKVENIVPNLLQPDDTDVALELVNAADLSIRTSLWVRLYSPLLPSVLGFVLGL